MENRILNAIEQIQEHCCKLMLTNVAFANSLNPKLIHHVFGYVKNWEISINTWSKMLYGSVYSQKSKSSPGYKIYHGYVKDRDIESSLNYGFSTWTHKAYSASKHERVIQLSLLKYEDDTNFSREPWFQEVVALFEFLDKKPSLDEFLTKAKKLVDFLKTGSLRN
jgi:hypothetical protein